GFSRDWSSDVCSSDLAKFRRANGGSSIMTKWVYSFGAGAAEGNAGQKTLLGGKGANLAEMASIGLPVPPSLTITTEVCTYYYDHGQSYPAELKGQGEA